jgi:hypothetical protein
VTGPRLDNGLTARHTGGENGTPGFLFHGTLTRHLDSIAREGLVPALPTDFPFGEPTAVYLTTDRYQAQAAAWRRLGPEHGCILTVDVTGLPLVVLSFVTCPLTIGPERIRRIPSRCRHQTAEGAWGCGNSMETAPCFRGLRAMAETLYSPLIAAH